MALPPNHATAIENLLAIMAQLRAKDGGCPWDLEQRFDTIAPYTVEEAYEVLDAIERDDMEALKDELGDLLFQVVYHARMAEEAGLFDFDDVAAESAAKMIRRHPHVFATPNATLTSDQQVESWETVKQAERDDAGGRASAIHGVALALPALTRALKIQKRAARVGFDWTDPALVLDKVTEELNELRHEMDAGSDADRLEDELGDVLFTVVNLARRMKIEPEFALRRSTEKFSRRFRRVEELSMATDVAFHEQSIESLEAMWQAAKAEESQKAATSP